jgi:hypothetical protein
MDSSFFWGHLYFKKLLHITHHWVQEQFLFLYRIFIVIDFLFFLKL